LDGGPARPRAGRRIPLTDNHIHLDPGRGEGVGAAKKFEKAGGARLFLVNKTLRDWGLEGGDEAAFAELYRRTLGLAEEVEETTDLRVFPVLGIHPAEFEFLCRCRPLEEALRIGRGAIDLAATLVAEGKAVAIGEVGWPHYPVPDQVLEASRRLLSHALEKAAEVDCAVQLHTGSLTPEDFQGLRKMALDASLPPHRVIKHYAPRSIDAAEASGLFPSLIADRENIAAAREKGTRFLMESDYIDDLQRPGAVLGPKSVPRVSLRLLEEGILLEEDLWKIHEENVAAVYGIDGE
jgi:TatD-related deoxyribonuclease